MADEDTPVEGWDGDPDPILPNWQFVRPFDPVEEITEEQLAEILACWDRLCTPDMTAGARLVDLLDVEEEMTVEPIDVYRGSDPTNEALRTIPPDLFARYAADDPDVTPLGLLLYGTESPPS